MSKIILPGSPEAAMPERRLAKSAHVQGLGGRLYSEKMFEKAAGLVGGLGGMSGGANVLTSSPEIRNPLLNLINFYLPYDRKTLNQWIRYYDRFHPYVGNCIDIHGEFPISDWRFTGINDPKILQLFDEQKERADMLQWCFEASREYELIGEVFSFWNWDEEEGMFSDYVMINPDLLEVQSVNWGWGKKTIYTYEPPQELKELMNQAGDERIQELIDDLDPVVRENLYAGKRIPLDDFNVMSMIRKASPYESRGTSIIMRIIKELMYEDKLREAQYAIADQQITPVQIWKLGDPATGYMPTEEDLEDFRQLLLAGRHDPLFTIVSHGAINLDLVGYTGKLLPVIPEFEWVAKRVMVGLYTNESMVTGDGPTYSNAIVAMKVLQGRYQSKRDKIEKNFKKKIWEPLAQAYEFFDTTPAQLSHRIRTKRKLLTPGMEWNFKLDLTDQTQRIQYMMQLNEKMKLPMKTLCEVLDLDYNVIKKNLKDEEGTVFDGVYQDVRQKKAETSMSAGPEGGGDVGGDIAGGGAPVGGGEGAGEEPAGGGGGEEVPAAGGGEAEAGGEAG